MLQSGSVRDRLPVQQLNVLTPANSHQRPTVVHQPTGIFIGVNDAPRASQNNHAVRHGFKHRRERRVFRRQLRHQRVVGQHNRERICQTTQRIHPIRRHDGALPRHQPTVGRSRKFHFHGHHALGRLRLIFNCAESEFCQSQQYPKLINAPCNMRLKRRLPVFPALHRQQQLLQRP